MPESYRHCWRRSETSNEKQADLLYSRAKQRVGRSARSRVLGAPTANRQGTGNDSTDKDRIDNKASQMNGITLYLFKLEYGLIIV
jgi:hypothetical protein